MHRFRDKVVVQKAVLFLIALIIIAICSSAIGLKTTRVNSKFHSDEFIYCYYSGLLKAYVNGHFDNAFWRSELGYAAVPVGVYWIGSTIYFSKYNFMLQEPSSPWTLDLTLFLNSTEKFIKTHPFPYVEDMIHILRERMLLFRTLTCILLFVLVWSMGGYVPAAIAVFLTLRNKLFLELSSLVLLESIWSFQYFFNLLCICFYFRILSDKKPKMTLVVLCSVATGITLGLLAATKIHGGLNALILLILFAVFWIARWRAGCWDIRLFRITVLNVFFILLLALSVFIAVNPILHTDPIAGIRNIITTRLVFEQRHIAREPLNHLSDIFQRVIFIIKTLKLNIFRSVLSLLGIIFLLSKIKSSWRGGGAVYAAGVIVSFVVYLCAFLMFMRLGWPRYPSILVFYLNIFMGYSMWCILRSILKSMRR